MLTLVQQACIRIPFRERRQGTHVDTGRTRRFWILDCRSMQQLQGTILPLHDDAYVMHEAMQDGSKGDHANQGAGLLRSKDLFGTPTLGFESRVESLQADFSIPSPHVRLQTYSLVALRSTASTWRATK